MAPQSRLGAIAKVTLRATIMTPEKLRLFDEQLFIVFRNLTVSGVDVKASKGKILLMSEKIKSGQVYVQHLRTADGYYAAMEVDSCDAMDFCIGQKPRYETRLSNSSFLSSTSLSEASKKLGDEIGGIIRMPDLADVPSVIEKIQRRLSNLFIAKAVHGVTASR